MKIPQFPTPGILQFLNSLILGSPQIPNCLFPPIPAAKKVAQCLTRKAAELEASRKAAEAREAQLAAEAEEARRVEEERMAKDAAKEEAHAGNNSIHRCGQARQR